jgi:hypothetical protein
MGILDALMSSDPMVSAQRRGILEQLASMSGAQPIAPSMGQVAGAVSAGARQGKRDYMADEMAKFQYMTMDDGSFVKFNKLTGDIETLDKFPKATGTSYQIGNKDDEASLKKLKPNFNTSDYAPGTIVTIEKDKTLSFKEPSKKGTTLSQSNIDKNKLITQDRKFIDREFEKFKKIEGNENATMLQFYSDSLNKTSADGFNKNPNYVPELKRIISSSLNMLSGVEDKDRDKYMTAFAGVDLTDADLNVGATYDIVAAEYGNMTIEEIIEDNLKINKGAKREDIIKQLISANIIKAK